MIHKRTTEEVRRYDIFKLSIILLLLVLIFLMLLRDNNTSSVATPDGETTVSEADGYPASEESEADTTAEEAYAVESGTAAEETGTTAEESYPADSETDDADESDSPAEDTMLFTPAQGAVLEVGSNIFSGSGVPDSSVLLLADGEELGQTTVDENGNWYLEADLEAGEPVLEIQSIDSDGNVVTMAPVVTVEVVAAETIVSTPDLVLSETNLYAGNVELSGTGEPGQQVTIYIAGEEAATVEVAEDGSWNMPLDLQAGTHEISLQTHDESGEVVNEAGPFEVAVQEAIMPTVALPDADVFSGGMILSGTGQPGTRVQLYANDSAIGEADVDANGNYTIEVNLAVGKYNINVAALDESGNPEEIVPALSLPVLALVEPEMNIASGEALAYDLLSGLFVLHGTADPEAKLALIVDGEPFAEFEADDKGVWDLEADFEPGTHEVTLQQVDITGNVVSESETIIVELSQKSITVNMPDYSIAESSDIEEEPEHKIQLPAGEFDWSGQGEANEPVALVIDGELVGSVTTDTDGNWIISTNLESGEHEVQVGTFDEFGNIAGQSAAMALYVVDAARPTMETPQLDDSGKGSVSGTADENANISVTANGTVVGLTSADENGNWTLNVDLGTGSFEMQAYVMDEEGNIILSSATMTIDVEAAAETPEEETVINAATIRGEYSTLLAGLESAGLTQRLSEVDDAFTLFAPTDTAFSTLPDEVIAGWNENPEAYKEIMFNLVLEGANTSLELVEAEVLTTIAGTNLGITTDDTDVLVNGVPIEASIPAGNSVVHAIDQVILPPLGYQAQPPIIDISGVSIFTGDYLTVVGSAEPGTHILLQVSGENFGELAMADETGFWQASDDISSGVHEILAYMLDENGLLMAISQPVSLPVQ